MEKIRVRMSKIEDSRHPSYVKYALCGYFDYFIMCGELCGLDTLEDLMVYAKSKEDFLSMVDGKQIGAATLDVMHKRFGTSGEVTAVDGKAICSTAKGGNPHRAPQILNAYVTDSGITLAQESIHEKTNEIPVFQEMLTYLDAKDRLITADAALPAENIPQDRAEKGRLSVQLEGKSTVPAGGRPPVFEDDINRDRWESCQRESAARQPIFPDWRSKNGPDCEVHAIERIAEDHGHHSRETSYYSGIRI